MEKGFTKEGYAFIKSVVTPSAQGRHRQLRRDGAIIERTKAANAGTYFNPSVSAKHNKLNTGFWESIKNPYKGAKNLPEEFKHVIDREEITVQEWLEIKFNRPRGFYTSEKPDMFNRKGAVATYLQSFIYKLDDGVTVLDLDKEKDRVMYLLGVASNKIANSILEVNPLVHTHYIMEVNEGEDDKSKKYAAIEEAVAALYKLKTEMPDETLKRLAVVLGVVRGKVTMETVKNRLSDFLLTKGSDQKQNIDTFLMYYKLLIGTKDKREIFNYSYFAKEFVNNSIVTYYKGKYQWENATSLEMKDMGLSLDSVIQIISNNKEIFKYLISELETKTGIKYDLT